MEIAVMVLIGMSVFIGTLLATKGLVRHAGKRAAMWLATPLAIVSTYLAYMMFTAPGWDPIIYAIILVLGATPAWLGTLVGLLVGDSRRRYPTPPID